MEKALALFSKVWNTRGPNFPRLGTMSYAGEIAALATSACWTASSLSFAFAGARVGSLAVNIIRLSLAFAGFVILGLLLEGEALPFSATPAAWFWLSL
ncbi:MAG: hypothetical protein NTY53_09515, partial [Kiritimatiellaeota bacterium]|nr:hypothetical protein [Kiritimatiellota bacterium]